VSAARGNCPDSLKWDPGFGGLSTFSDGCPCPGSVRARLRTSKGIISVDDTTPVTRKVPTALQAIWEVRVLYPRLRGLTAPGFTQDSVGVQETGVAPNVKEQTSGWLSVFSHSERTLLLK